MMVAADMVCGYLIVYGDGFRVYHTARMLYIRHLTRK
jgi:hypothetical protein